jgi:hypothetical protein
VVGFDLETKFVWAHEENPAEALVALMQAGGEPLGLIGFLILPGECRVYHRPFAEYADEPGVEQYLAGLHESVRRHAAEERGIRARPGGGRPEDN